MNYKEASDFVESKKNLIGKKIFIPTIQGMGILNQFVIAPTGKLLDILGILSKTEVDNQTALNQCALTSEDLSVFVIGKNKTNELFPMSYDDFIKTKDAIV